MSDNKNKLGHIRARVNIVRLLLGLSIACAFLMRTDLCEAGCNSPAGAQYNVYVNSLTAYDSGDDDISAVVSGTSSITFDADISDDLQPSVGSADMTATWSGGDISYPATTWYTQGPGVSQYPAADDQTLTTPGEQTITFTLTGDSGCSASKTMTVDVLNVQFIDNSTNVASSDGSYDAEDNNLTNSYDTDQMSWTLSHVAGQGVDTASIPDSTSGEDIEFGTGGGEYKVTATSDDGELDPEPSATFTLKVIKVAFVSGITNMWTQGGTYSAAGNLTDDSFNTNNLTWDITCVEGDDTAGIYDNGLVTYGLTCGGEYTVTATSSDLTNVVASFTLDLVSVQLTNMTFNGGADLLTDTGGNYPVPEWTINGMTNSPYLYQASDATHQRYASVTAKFTVEPLDFTGNITFYGNGSVTPWLFATTPVAASSGIATTGPVTIPIPLGISVRCWNPLQINWTYSISSIDQIGFYDAGQTANQVYVCLANPTPTYHTVVNFACSSGYATDINTAFANTWALFTNGGTGPKNITTWNGKTLYYYKNGFGWAHSQTSAAGLLYSANSTDPWAGHGQCGSFADLLVQSAAVNGVPAVRATARTINRDEFIVNDWLFGIASYGFPGFSGINGFYPWNLTLVQEPNNLVGMVPAPPNRVYGDMTKQPTLYGQNSAPTPPSEEYFILHCVVLYNNLYYDPSYGVTYTDANDLETKAVAGYVDPDPVSGLDYPVRPAIGSNNMILNP